MPKPTESRSPAGKIVPAQITVQMENKNENTKLKIYFEREGKELLALISSSFPSGCFCTVTGIYYAYFSSRNFNN